MSLASLRSTMPDEASLPAFAWPGGYPIVYVTEDGLVVCPVCANEADTSDPVTDGDVFWEGAPITCDDCGKPIESAYGEEVGAV